MRDPRTVKSIADWRLCVGCGACAYVCPGRKIGLVDILAEGIRPIVRDQNCGECRLCLEVCPAFENDHTQLRLLDGMKGLPADFGPVLEVWEGYARDPEIRHRGASGGAITAISLSCLEQAGMYGVLHLHPHPNDPLRNRTNLSRTRASLLSGTGSRYSPGSVCEGLGMLEAAPSPCVFVGQPCEVTALRKAQRIRPQLEANVGVALSFFCAGSPATSGTAEVLNRHGVCPSQVSEVRYRGLGWPGGFSIREKTSNKFRVLMSYEESWAALQRFRPYGIYLFPDISGEDADISCADAWNRTGGTSDGFSLVVVRTARGRDVVKTAIDSGYLVAERVSAERLMQAQRPLIGHHAANWGRVATFKILGLPVPKLRGFGSIAAWWRLPWRSRLRSTVGTARRIISRRYYRPMQSTAEAQLLPAPSEGGVQAELSLESSTSLIPPRPKAVQEKCGN